MPVTEILSWICFFGLLAAAGIFDKRTGKIPDCLTAAIAVLAVCSFFCGIKPPAGARLAGGLCVSLPMTVITLAYPGAFGGGDIKLMAAAGLFLGPMRTTEAFGIAVIMAGGYAVRLLLSGRAKGNSRLRLGPFLCLGIAAAVLLFPYS